MTGGEEAGGKSPVGKRRGEDAGGGGGERTDYTPKTITNLEKVLRNNLLDFLGAKAAIDDAPYDLPRVKIFSTNI